VLGVVTKFLSVAIGNHESLHLGNSNGNCSVNRLSKYPMY
jgi:hypothetical protein